MTSIPASRRARAMILAPRSCPSSPGFATTTRIFFFVGVAAMSEARAFYADRHPCGFDVGGLRSQASGRPPGGRGSLGVLACSLIALLLAGGGAGGTKYMETTLQDDALFLHRPAPVVRRSAKLIASLGADRLRLTAGWSALAPASRSRKMPGRPFDPADSSTYPAGSWSALDTAVKAARDAGLNVQIDLAFWAPRWAVKRRSRNPARQRWWPDPGAFGTFAAAAAHRYSGSFPHPTNHKRALPAVRMWTT